MLDGLLLKAIQILSRATKAESIASLLLKISHQMFVLEKSILILERPSSKNETTNFLTVVAERVDATEDTNSIEPTITFYRTEVEVDKAIAPYSLYELCRHQPQPKFVFETANSLSDIYLKQQKPDNFSYLAIVDRQQFFGILYLENVCERSLTSQTKKAIAILSTQTAIALKQARRYRERVVEAQKLAIGKQQLKDLLEQQQQAQKALEAEIKQKSLLEKIGQKIRSCIDLEAVFKTTVREIGTTFEVTRCQVHNYLQTPESQIPVFAVYDESKLAQTHDSPMQFSAMGIDTKRVLKQERAIAVDNVYESSRLKLASSVFKHWQIKSLLAVKTSYRGKVNGLIMLHQCDRFRQWTTTEIATIESVASQVGVAIAHANLLEREKRQRVALDRQNYLLQQEIRDRKQQEKQLKENQQRYRALATAAPVGIFRADVLGNFTYVNERWCRITGFSASSAMGRGWLSAIHPKNCAWVTQQWQEAIKNNAPFCGEYRFLTPANTEVWVFGQAVAEYDGEGKLLGYVGTITDISQLKQSQKVLAKQLRKEQLLGQITQEIRRNLDTEAIFQTAASQIGHIFQVNRCLIHKYVHTPKPQVPLMAQYLGEEAFNPLNVLVPVNGNLHLEKILSQDLAVISSDIRDEPLLQEPQTQQLCRDYQIKSMLVVRTSYQSKPNGIIGLHQCDRYRTWTIDEVELLEAVALQMGIAIAQAELLEKEQQQSQELYLNNLALSKAKQDAEIANQAKSQFLAHMSHELRTPLNAILGFSQIMAQDDSLDSSQQEQLTIINHSGQHLLNLINNILDLSKIEARKTLVQQHRFDFHDFINRITKMFQLQAQTKGLQLSVDLSSDVPQYIITDGVKLKQIIINLLNNALKFTEEGTVSLQIKSQNQHSLIFKITDSGVGIPKAELDRIFEPFEQTETGIQSGQGTGLGLSICRSLIKLLAGMLEVESVVGLGTTFLFQIPIQIADSDVGASEIFVIEQTIQTSAQNLEITSTHELQTTPTIELEVLDQMPKQWLEKLHYAAISASDRKIHQTIDLIADEHPTLADDLRAMVNNFALEGIINQTEILLALK